MGFRFLSPSVKEMAKNAGSELWISAGSQHGAFFNLVEHSGYGKGDERWRGLVESGDLKHGRAILIFEGPVLRNALPLLWQSLEGRKEYATKQVAKKPKTVPVVVRSEKDCLSPFTLPAGVARVTDQSMLIH